MSRIFLFFALFLFAFALPGPSPSLWTGPGKLNNKPVPRLNGKTIAGVTIDSAFFTGKVTLITFMFIGCPPCMKELPIMNKLDSIYKGKPFNVLAIAPHIGQHLKDFNSSNNTPYSQARRAARADSITYHMLPECAEVKITRKDNRIGPECSDISALFNVRSYPTAFLVDKKGVIRKVWEGFEVGAPEDYLLEKYTSEIDKLLGK
jgi:thiol-disulfide isomerase/thioredoxin